MTVALLDLGLAVGLTDEAALLERGRVEAEPHRAAQVAGTVDERLLLLHRRDDRRLGLRVELRRRRPRDPEDAPGVLDDHALEAEADPERRDQPLARPPQGTELALDPADAEAPGNENRVDPAERLLCARLGVWHSSEATQRMRTLASWWNPPARRASVTDR